MARARPGRATVTVGALAGLSFPPGRRDAGIGIGTERDTYATGECAREVFLIRREAFQSRLARPPLPLRQPREPARTC